MSSLWKSLLSSEWNAPYFVELQQFLQEQKALDKIIYPASEQVFHALDATPFEKVRVVILGQDPYHGIGQAHGLSFSVPRGVALPPSLRNIYKELASDTALPLPNHGCLEDWTQQGVLLLNTVLTVEHGKAGSHHGKGWEKFTDRIIEILNEKKEGLVFILWGKPAQKKAQAVDGERHHLILSPHPSPLSSYRGFFGSKPFSKTNAYFRSQGMPEIDWQIRD